MYMCFQETEFAHCAGLPGTSMKHTTYGPYSNDYKNTSILHQLNKWDVQPMCCCYCCLQKEHNVLPSTYLYLPGGGGGGGGVLRTPSISS